MYLINDIKVNIDYTDSDIKDAVSKKIGAKISSFIILKRAIDARRRPVKYVLNLAVEATKPIDLPTYLIQPHDIKSYLINDKIAPLKGNYIVVGAGPSGLFSALTLLERGANVTIIERGDKVEDRQKAVASFYSTGVLNTESNIQFGEGGAGTFSDGKLNTGVNNPLIGVVLNEFVSLGADPDIAYSSRPHIGTDVLIKVVKSFRERIISLGGILKFREKVTDLIIRGDKAIGVKTDKGEYLCDGIVLAIGHSARDTYRMLISRGILTEAKGFAVGARVEHSQELINLSQYGKDYDSRLPSAEYRLAAKTTDGRGCFTFCMCPGGYVTAATSETGSIVTNGMSERARDGANANSAVLVGVTPSDYGDSPIKAIEYQETIERNAFLATGGYSAPAVSVTDFLADKVSNDLDKYYTTYPLGVKSTDFRCFLPEYIVKGMQEGLRSFNNKIHGFDRGVLTACETRSSAPIRIIRNEAYTASVKGLYPCGEGAGYAGGITSSAVDGIKTALAIKNN